MRLLLLLGAEVKQRRAENAQGDAQLYRNLVAGRLLDERALMILGQPLAPVPPRVPYPGEASAVQPGLDLPVPGDQVPELVIGLEAHHALGARVGAGQGAPDPVPR